jgi:hypothetical protein
LGAAQSAPGRATWTPPAKIMTSDNLQPVPTPLGQAIAAVIRRQVDLSRIGADTDSWKRWMGYVNRDETRAKNAK